jgi:hypothetical protein
MIEAIRHPAEIFFSLASRHPNLNSIPITVKTANRYASRRRRSVIGGNRGCVRNEPQNCVDRSQIFRPRPRHRDHARANVDRDQRHVRLLRQRLGLCHRHYGALTVVDCVPPMWPT